LEQVAASNAQNLDISTVWPRRGFANSFSFPTGMLLGNNPFTNSRTLPSVIGFWAVGEDFFPDNGISCWERVSSPTAQVLAVGKALGCWRSHSFLLCPNGWLLIRPFHFRMGL
jgi:hypothetical protein